jgi:hypothetical protein
LSSNKATKTLPSHLELNKLLHWSATVRANASIWEITGGEAIVENSSLTRIALQEALVALTDVITRCDEAPGDDLIHSAPIVYLYDFWPNALRSKTPELCVSGCRTRDPTVMLSHVPSNEDAVRVYQLHDVFTLNVIGGRSWLRRRLL